MNSHALDRPQPAVRVALTGYGFVRPPRRPVTRALRHAADLALDIVILVAMILFFPSIILGIGIPVALVVQIVLWIGRQA
jgi:hypothetical protein